MTDEQAMLAVKEGDLDKAAVLYERYKKALLNFFLYRQNSRETARDLTQQVFLRLLRYRHTFREGASFRTWVHEIARNVFHDHLKTVRVQTDIIPDLPETDDPADDRHEQLHFALQQLPEGYRDVLVLSRFQNMSYEEIGELLGLSVANVKVRAFRGLQKLRDLYFQLDRP
ncbi:MAG: RNA polymerase sigma factor [Siphonobacter aquaeclarae]|jgi:RNA polymerase sigma factor (sigma-70 family)|nr:RNA polymerase sigma factor [Siphonobacter aquaeclarae]